MMHNVWFRKFGRYLVMMIVGILAIWGLGVLTQRLLMIRTIEVAGVGVDVVIDTETFPKNILYVRLHELRSAILAENALLADVVIKKKFPSTIVVIPTLRTPVARLSYGNTELLLDDQGVLLGFATTEVNLPLVKIYSDTGKIGQKVRDQRIKIGLEFLKKLSPDIHVLEVLAPDTHTIQFITDGPEILISDATDVAQAVSTLQTLFSGFRIKGIVPTRVDLRFGKPIIKMYGS